MAMEVYKILSDAGGGEVVTCLAFNKGKNELYTGSQDNKIRAWDLDSGDLKRVMTLHKGWVTDLVYAAPLKLIFSRRGRRAAASLPSLVTRRQTCAPFCGPLLAQLPGLVSDHLAGERSRAPNRGAQLGTDPQPGLPALEAHGCRWRQRGDLHVQGGRKHRVPVSRDGSTQWAADLLPLPLHRDPPRPVPNPVHPLMAAVVVAPLSFPAGTCLAARTLGAW